MLRQWILTASVLTAAALILRLIFHKRISQRLQYALWLPVLLRLLLPFALFSAPVSVPAAAERLAPAVFATASPRTETVLPVTEPVRPPAVSAAPIVPSGETAELRPVVTPAPSVPAPAPAPGKTLDWPRILRFIWLDGSLVLALWLLGVNLGFRNKLRRSRTLFREGKTPVYVSEAAASPCLFGLFRPAVYLTPGAAELPEEQLEQVLLHERTHLRQGDPVWGLLRCLCLAVWWWNPLVWLAAACSRRDGELSCDEKVLRTLGEDRRLEYGHTLVDLLPRKTPGALLCTATISGGGRDMKERLERIVKKPKLWIAAAILAVLLTALIVGCSFAGKGEEEAAPTPSATAAPASNWQEQYRELVEKAMEADYPYVEWGSGPIQAMALMDLSGNGTPELVLFFPGGGDTYTTMIVTMEEGELRCLSRENLLGLPPSANAVEGSIYYPHEGSIPGFQARPSVTAVDEDFFYAFFRYYYTADEGGNIREGFYLLNSGDGVEGDSWCTWFRFGQDEEGRLLCKALLKQGLDHDISAEGMPETWWAIDGEECTAEEYHAAVDAFNAWRDQYRYLPGTWEQSCVVFRNEADPLAAVDRALGAWTPLPAAVPASGDMGRDRFPLPEGAVWLTEEELGDWEEWFAADWMRGQFLTSLYEKPEDVDLHELFYIGVDPEGAARPWDPDRELNPITPEDKRAYLLHLGDWMTECPTDKLPRAQMDAVLRKYLGIGLEETNRIRLSYSYLPETDCYYHAHGDTNYLGIPDLLYGYAQGDEVDLFYGDNRRVVLRRDGEEIRFVSHLEVLTGRNGVIVRTPEVGPSIPTNETGDYGRDVTRLQRQALAEAPEAAETWGKEGYGVLKYGETETGPCLWFGTPDGALWRLPTPVTAEGALPRDGTGSGASEGRGYFLNVGDDPDLISWSMYCPEDTILGENAARRGGWAVWTVYLPTMETFICFRTDDDRQDDTLQAGSDEWLERIFGGAESLSVQFTDRTGLSRTVDIPMTSCRDCLRSCAWTGPNGPGADTPETEYTLTLRGGDGELILYQGSTLGRLYLGGEESCYQILASATDSDSNRSPADKFRRQVFDPAESSAATGSIRVEAAEEDPALVYVQKLCEAMKDLAPGSSWGIQDYEIRGVASEEHEAQKELALHTVVYLLPNVWNSVPWWAGAGMEPAAGEYEGWLIMDVYYLLELKDGAWRYKDSAQYAPNWGSLELDPEPTPEPAQGSWQPVTMDLGTDWLTLPKGARWLTREELDEWTAWFNADWMRWSFLTSAYARPQDVDLGALFYTGVDLRESSTRDYSQNAVTGKDLRYYLLHRGTFEHTIDLDKLPRVQMDDLLRKYLGIGLEETNKIGLWFPYFPETDAYYHLHGDTNWGPFPLRYGFAVGDEVCLFNQSTWNHGQFGATGYNNGGEGIYRTVLRKEGDSVRFVSNLRALTNGTEAAYDVPWQNDAYPDGYEEERDVQVITLIPEVYESREAAREYVESLGFMVTYDPGSENEYTEKLYPIEILYEQTCPGFGTLVYGEIPTGTVHGSNPYLWFITADGRLYRLPLPLGGSNIRLEHDGQNSADEGRGVRLLDSRSDMLRWWMRLSWETNLYVPADAWAGGEMNVQSSGTATWTLYLPTMEVFLLYEPEG